MVLGTVVVGVEGHVTQVKDLRGLVTVLAGQRSVEMQHAVNGLGAAEELSHVDREFGRHGAFGEEGVGKGQDHLEGRFGCQGDGVESQKIVGKAREIDSGALRTVAQVDGSGYDSRQVDDFAGIGRSDGLAAQIEVIPDGVVAITPERARPVVTLQDFEFDRERIPRAGNLVAAVAGCLQVRPDCFADKLIGADAGGGSERDRHVRFRLRSRFGCGIGVGTCRQQQHSACSGQDTGDSFHCRQSIFP